jgi:hypothetical protein
MRVSRRSWPLAVSVVLIALATLRPGSDTSATMTSLCLLCGLRGLADFVSNVILFLPFGLGLALHGARFRSALIVSVLSTTVIEILQVELISGRDASLGDIVANSAGAALGWLLGYWRPWRKARALGLRGASALTAATCAGLLIGLVLLRPVAATPPFFLFWTPEKDNLEHYRGRVLSTRLGPLSWQRGLVTMEPGTTVESLLRTEPIEVLFLAGPAPRQLAPIVTINSLESEIVLLGAVGTDFVYRYYALADVVRLDHGDLRIPGVFAEAQPGDTIDAAFGFSTRRYCLDVNERPSCGGGFAVGDTWTLLSSPDLTAAASRAAALVWLWLIFIPAGYVSSSPRRVLALAGGAVVCLIAAPLMLGFAMTPWAQLGGVLTGMFSGFAAAGAYRRFAGPQQGQS